MLKIVRKIESTDKETSCFFFPLTDGRKTTTVHAATADGPGHFTAVEGEWCPLCESSPGSMDSRSESTPDGVFDDMPDDPNASATWVNLRQMSYGEEDLDNFEEVDYYSRQPPLRSISDSSYSTPGDDYVHSKKHAGHLGGDKNGHLMRTDRPCLSVCTFPSCR